MPRLRFPQPAGRTPPRLVLLSVAALAALTLALLPLLPRRPTNPAADARPATRVPAERDAAPERARAEELLAKLPMSFEANEGQVRGGGGAVKFLARGPGYNLFLTPTEAVLSLDKSGTGTEKDVKARGGKNAASKRGRAVVRMSLAGANPRPEVVGGGELPGKSNYFIGRDSSKWRTNVATFGSVNYSEVYPGVSLVYYGTGRQLEYDFHLAPGADPRRIKLNFKGAERLEVEAATGDLVLHVEGGGEVRQHRPVTYQEVDGARKEIAAGYRLTGRRSVEFELGEYDAALPLVIDPVLTYATYFGGDRDDDARSVFVDSSGMIYLAGDTNSSEATFPIAGTPFDGTHSGGADEDIFVSKLDPTQTGASQLVYSTYLGAGGDDHGLALAVDSAGNAHVAGQTLSGDSFPAVNGYRTTAAGVGEGFLTKFDSTGSNLLYSTYVGGNGIDEATGVALDAAGKAYVTGKTNSTDLAITNGFQTTYGGGASDAFVFLLDPAGPLGQDTLVYSTYLGGSGDEGGTGTELNRTMYVATDAAGRAYVVTSTSSDVASLPPLDTTADAYQANNAGGFDAYIVRVDPSLAGAATRSYATYFGGAGNDHGVGVAVGATGVINFAGDTRSTDLPVQNAFKSVCDCAGSGDAFLVQLDPAQTPASQLRYATYFGGDSNEEVSYGVALGTSGSVYLMGRTSSGPPDTFPTRFPIQPQRGGVADVFVAKFFPALVGSPSLSYSTYVGGTQGGPGDNGSEESLRAGNPLAVGKGGDAYMAFTTVSTDLPLQNPLQGSFNGGAGGTDGALVRVALGPGTAFTVNTTADTDNGACEPVGTNNGCTLREAVNAANANAGTDTIAFEIPGTDVHKITVNGTGLGQLPVITEGVLVHGYSQPGSAPNTISLPGTGGAGGNDAAPFIEIDGSLQSGHLLQLAGGGTTLRGLVINGTDNGDGVRIDTAGNNVVEGCLIGTNAAGTAAVPNRINGVRVNGTSGNRIGGSAPEAFNVISGNAGAGVLLTGGASSNIVQGNQIGTNAAGTAALANGTAGVLVNSSSLNGISGNLISGNSSHGVEITGATAANNAVRLNRIGLNAAGTGAVANGGDGVFLHNGAFNTSVGGVGFANNISGNTGAGVRISDAGTLSNAVDANAIGLFSDAVLGFVPLPNAVGVSISAQASGNRVGGSAADGTGGNLIGFNASHGVEITGLASGNLIQRNRIGVDDHGAVIGNGGDGVRVSSANNNLIGGANAALGNRVANNANGVVVVGSGAGNAVLSNALSDNAGLDIDLGADGATANDAGDPDAGPNNFQNHPVVTSATVFGGNLRLSGTLNSTPNTVFTVQFFTDDNGTLLHTAQAATDANGNATFTFTTATPTPPIPAGVGVAATATDPANNTSELSPVSGLSSVAACGAASFNAPSNLASVATDPVSVAVGDFTGDGRPDIVTANETGDSVSLFVNDGSGTFRPGRVNAPRGFNAGVNFTVGDAPRALVVADFNNDGKLDAATVNRGSSDVTVLLGDGAGGFPSVTNYPFLSFVTAIAADDFNGDGFPELAVADDSDNGVGMLLNDGAGGFTDALVGVATGDDPSSIATGDLNGDGKTDFATADTAADTVSISFGDGALGFTPAITLNAGDGPTGVVIVDLTGEGAPDIVTADSLGDTVSVFLNDGAGNFSVPDPPRFAAGVTPFALVAGDFNGDGFADIVTANRGEDKAAVLFGTGNGRLTEPAALFDTADEPVSIAAGDFDGDGKPDLTTANRGAGDNVSVLMNSCTAPLPPTFTVNSTADTDNSACEPDGTNNGCTLREAINAANEGVGTLNTVSFNIPAATDPGCNAATGVCTIAPLSALPVITDPVVINGTTQPGYAAGAPVIELNGAGAGALSNGLHITAGGSTVRGLVINRFFNNGILLLANGGNTVEANFIGVGADGATDLGNAAHGITVGNGSNGNQIGGSPSARNVISGNSINGITLAGGASLNTIRSNYVGTNVAGTAAVPNDANGIEINNSSNNTLGGGDVGNIISGNAINGVYINSGSANNALLGNLIGTNATGTAAVANGNIGVRVVNALNNTIGTSAGGARNIISGNVSSSVGIEEANSTGNKVQGNYIGTDSNGLTAIPNGAPVGIASDASDNLIGGAAAGEGNVISGNLTNGVALFLGASVNRVEGNFIGVDSTGVGALGNGNRGVVIFDAATTGNIIGGFVPAARNVIAHNAQEGVGVNGGTNNAVLGNSIFANGTTAQQLGIDLVGADGVDANDANDSDTGPNNLQNFPVITSAQPSGGSTVVQGTLNSTPSTSGFRIEFFSNSSCDAAGNGEGQTFLGTITVNTDASGNATINTTLPAATAVGQFVTATATGPGGGTSEFSACFALGGPCTTAPAGVVSWYPGDGTAEDIGPNNLDGTPANGAAFAPGVVAGSFALDGADDYVDIGQQPQLQGASAITVMAWVYKRDTNNFIEGIVGKWDGCTGCTDDSFLLYNGEGGNVNKGTFVVRLDDDSAAGVAGTTDIPVGQWVHVAASWRSSDGQIVIYKNGVAEGASAGGAGRVLKTVNGYTAKIGQWGNRSGNPVYHFSGQIDEATLFNRALSAAEIAAVYNAGGGGACRPSFAQTFTVTNTNDTGAGSLRQAIADANANAGLTDTIAFNIAGAGVHTIAPVSALPTITDPVVIDGYTQPGASANTLAAGNDAVIRIELDGSTAGAGANGLAITAGASVVRGLAILDFDGAGVLLQSGDGNTVAGNFIGTNAAGAAAATTGNVNGVVIESGSANNTIGGATPAARNIISGNDAVSSGNVKNGVVIRGAGTDGNAVVGNHIGTNPAGAAPVPNGNIGIHIFNGAQNNTVGGTTVAERNVIAANPTRDITISGAGTNNNVVRGNYVGTNAAGTAGLDSNALGVTVAFGATANTVGGAAAGERNVISGNSVGVFLFGSSGNSVQGNLIGTDAAGTAPVPNTAFGVLVTDATGNTVGGTAAGAGNLIAFSGLQGIVMTGSSAGNALSGNSIHSNTQLGIDLNQDGVTPNDANDADAGPNNLQNFPVLTSASVSGGTTTVAGTFNSEANQTYRVEFFSTPTCDASGNGEGQTLVGSANVTTDGAGNAPVNSALAVALTIGHVVTATATDPAGNTSEFSACRAVTGPPTFDLSVSMTDSPDPATVGGSVTYTVTVANNGNSTATGVRVNDTLPAGATFVSATPSQGSCGAPSGGLVQCLLGSVSGGSSATVAVVVTPTQTGSMTNSAAAVMNETDAAPGDESASQTTTVNAPPAVFNVTNTNDGGAGSFRQAILDANAAPGAQSIAFQIAGAGPHVIAPTSALPAVTEAVTIDGYTQPGASPNTQAAGDDRVLQIVLSGANLAGLADGLAIGAGGVTVRGLVVNNFGGSGVVINGGSGSVVEGNFIGTDAAGAGVAGGGLRGVYVNNANNNTVGGATPAARNLLSGHSRGVEVFANSTGNTVSGNRIGTNAAGTTAIPNTLAGVMINAASGNTVGTPAGAPAASGNLISGNAVGVMLTQFSTNNRVAGNLIGTDAAGTAALSNASHGVHVQQSSNGNTVGGAAQFASNRIAFNGGEGVLLDAGANNRVSANSINANTGLGIRLTNGANGDPAAPVVTSAVASGGQTTVQGTLSGAPNTAYTIEFFSSPACDASGAGEGETFLGSTTATTDAAGAASFNATLPGAVTIGHVVTATATNPSGATSQFSACATVAGPPASANLSLNIADSPDPVTVNGQLTYTIGVGNGGPNDATNVTVTDTLPAGVTFVSATSPISGATCGQAAGTVICNLGTLSAGAGNANAVSIVVNAPAAPTMLGNTASLSSPVGDPDNTNNSATATTTVTAAPTHSITGRVADASNNNLSGVTITLSGSQSATTNTDAGGNYSFAGLAAGGNYTVTPSLANYTFAPPSRAFNNLSANQTGDFTGTLNTHTIAGRVTSGANGLAGVTVRLERLDAGGIISTLIAATTTDAAGNYSFANVAAGGDYTVTPDLTNYTFAPPSRAFNNLSANQTGDFTGTLNTHTISGRVADGSNNSLAGVTVTLSGAQSATVQTDANGNYSFANLPAGGNYAVTPSQVNYTFAPASRAFNNLSANQTGDFTGTLNTHTISGRVADANNSPLAGVTLTLSGTQAATTTTNASGNYSFASLPAGGSYTVTPGLTNYTFAPPSRAFNNLSANQTGDFTGTLNTFAIAGRVTSGANGLAGVTVTLTGAQPATTTTDAGGNYSFANLAAGGNYTVAPSLANFAFTPPSRTFNGLNANQTADFAATVVLVNISGRVTDENGQSVAGVPVTLTGEAGQTLATATTDAAGNYSFNAPAGGDYAVTPARAGLIFVPPVRFYEDLAAAQTADFTALDAFVISGNLQDLFAPANGNRVRPLAAGGGVVVTLSGTRSGTTVTDADGNYTFPNLPLGGDYRVTPENSFRLFDPPFLAFPNLGSSTDANFGANQNPNPTPTPPIREEFGGGPLPDPSRFSIGTLTQPPGATDELVTVVQTGGKLVVTPRANFTGLSFNGYVTVRSVDFTDATASIAVDQIAAGGAQTIFSVGRDEQNFFRFVAQQQDVPTTVAGKPGRVVAVTLQQLILQARVAGVFNNLAITYDPVAHKYWRFRHDTSTSPALLKFEASPSGQDNTWALLRAVAIPGAIGSLSTEMGAGTSGAVASPGQAVFDDLNVVPPQTPVGIGTLGFGEQTVTVAESAGSVTVKVRRAGGLAAESRVELASEPFDNQPCRTTDGKARARCDFATTFARLRFAPGETEKSVTIFITDDVYAEGTESFRLALGNSSLGFTLDAPLVTVRITDDDAGGAPNPVNSAPYFVRQQYRDFLSREPDPAGGEAWTNVLLNCAYEGHFGPGKSGSDPGCDRILVSSGFYRSPEFHERGFYAYRFYDAALGRLPLYDEFLADMQGLAGPQTLPQQEASKRAFVEDFMTRGGSTARPSFATLYGGFTNGAAVDALLTRANVTLPNRNQLVADLEAGRKTPAETLRLIAESEQVSARFYNRAFVAMQYFGYLQRDPEPTGFNAWLGVLNSTGDFRTMIFGFLYSAEYQSRFGPTQ